MQRKSMGRYCISLCRRRAAIRANNHAFGAFHLTIIATGLAKAVIRASRYCGRGALTPNLIAMKTGEGRMFGFALCLTALSTLSMAGDDARKSPLASAAPLENPHTAKIQADAKTSRKKETPGNFERQPVLDLKPGLAPLPFPKNSDIRARLLTPELRRTPVVGWVAANLYRDKSDNGWCLEVDPGEGEYAVFYRLHLK